MIRKNIWPTYLLKVTLNTVTMNIGHEFWSEHKHTMTDTNPNIVFWAPQYNLYLEDLHNLLDEKGVQSYDPEKLGQDEGNENVCVCVYT